MPTNDEIEAETYRVAKRRKCDKGTFTVCWGEHERGEVCRCKEEARTALTAAGRAALANAKKRQSPSTTTATTSSTGAAPTCL
jgi:hypothetical protein